MFERFFQTLDFPIPFAGGPSTPEAITCQVSFSNQGQGAIAEARSTIHSFLHIRAAHGAAFALSFCAWLSIILKETSSLTTPGVSSMTTIVGSSFDKM